ncbi:MAG: hypothetical protein WBG90_12430 [Saonia sp.]
MSLVEEQEEETIAVKKPIRTGGILIVLLIVTLAFIGYGILNTYGDLG